MEWVWVVRGNLGKYGLGSFFNGLGLGDIRLKWGGRGRDIGMYFNFMCILEVK